MKPKRKTKKAINNVAVGKFVKCNGSTLYVYKSNDRVAMWASLDGILTIEKHPEKSLFWPGLENYTLISKPKKKHVDNAIKQIKDSLKFKSINNLTYIENLSILKNYLKPAIVKIRDKHEIKR